MRPNGRSITPQAVRQIVLIDEVDVQSKQAHVKDRNMAHHIAVFRNANGLSQIPQAGEVWYAETISTNEMHLVERQDTADEHLQKVGDANLGIPAMQEGDGHLRLPGTLHIRAESITFASKAHQSDPKPFGVPMKDTATGNGTITLYALTRAPIPASLVIYKNGVYMHETADYTLSGSNVTFVVAPANAAKLAFHYQSDE